MFTGGERDFVIGGFADDTIHSGSHNDVVLGDNGFGNFDQAGLCTHRCDGRTDLGGNDHNYAGLDEDVAFGGMADDFIHGNNGHGT